MFVQSNCKMVTQMYCKFSVNDNTINLTKNLDKTRKCEQQNYLLQCSRILFAEIRRNN